jgi:hypothetical protein
MYYADVSSYQFKTWTPEEISTFKQFRKPAILVYGSCVEDIIFNRTNTYELLLERCHIFSSDEGFPYFINLKPIIDRYLMIEFKPTHVVHTYGYDFSALEQHAYEERCKNDTRYGYRAFILDLELMGPEMENRPDKEGNASEMRNIRGVDNSRLSRTCCVNKPYFIYIGEGYLKERPFLLDQGLKNGPVIQY